MKTPGLVPWMLLTLAVLAFGAAEAHAQDTLRLWSEIDPPVPVAGRTFVVRVNVLGWSGQAYRIVEPTLVPDLLIVSGPAAREDLQQGSLVFSYSVRSRRAGQYTLGGFLLRLGTRTLFTDSLVFRVTQGTAAGGGPGAALRWVLRVPEEGGDGGRDAAGGVSVWVGQSVSVRLEISGADTIPLPEEIQITPPQHALFERVEGSPEVIPEPDGDPASYVVPIRLYALTPTRSGSVVLPQARARLEGDVWIVAPSVSLTVRAPPASLGSIHAVGSFSYRSRVSASEVVVGEEIEVTLILEGLGGFPLVRFPELEVEGLHLVRRETRERFEPALGGYRGAREEVLVLVAREEGTYEVRPPAFRAFEPLSGAVAVLEIEPIRIHAAGTEAAGPDRGIPLPGAEEILRLSRRRPYAVPWYYLLLLPGPCAWALQRAFRAVGGRRRRGLPVMLLALLLLPGGCGGGSGEDAVGSLLSAASGHAQRGEWSRAVRTYLEAAHDVPVSSGVDHALAACYDALGERGLAIYHLRRALGSYPSAAVLHEALSHLESSYQLTAQARRGPPVDPLIPWALAVALVNGVFLLLFARGAGAGVGVLIAAVLLCVGGLGSTGAFVATLTRHPTATVVLRETVVRKVPHPAGSAWQLAPEGTTLGVMHRAPGWVGVRTEDGRLGWMEERSVLVLEGGGYRSR